MDDRLSRIDAAAATLRPEISRRGTRVAVVLGSGLGGVADALGESTALPYSEIPGFPRPSVQGHSGEAVFGRIGGAEVVALSGRAHLYEGVSADDVVLPVRALAMSGVETLVLTNAAGGLADTVSPGDIVMLSDHINMMGRNPLIGPNIDALGPRFPGMAHVYDEAVRAAAHAAATRAGVELREGVYVGVLGPSYETPAEVAAFRGMGGDVVGMSTVPETIAAAHAGMRVAGFSIVTNMAGSSSDDHEAVLALAGRAAKNLTAVLLELLPDL